MKKFVCSFMAAILTLGPVTITAEAEQQPMVSVFHEGVHFAESAYPYDGGIFISNFGSEKIKSQSGENKGYIIYRKDGINKTIVPANGTVK